METLIIRVVKEYDAPDLKEWLAKAAKESGKPISAICREAEITTQYWHALIKEKNSIRFDTLEKLERAIGKKYPTPWRDSEA